MRRVWKMLRIIFGFKEKDKSKQAYEIKPDMVSPDVVRMNLSSFRNSSVVQKQVAAAKASVTKQKSIA